MQRGTLISELEGEGGAEMRRVCDPNLLRTKAKAGGVKVGRTEN